MQACKRAHACAHAFGTQAGRAAERLAKARGASKSSGGSDGGGGGGGGIERRRQQRRRRASGRAAASPSFLSSSSSSTSLLLLLLLLGVDCGRRRSSRRAKCCRRRRRRRHRRRCRRRRRHLPCGSWRRQQRWRRRLSVFILHRNSDERQWQRASKAQIFFLLSSRSFASCEQRARARSLFEARMIMFVCGLIIFISAVFTRVRILRVVRLHYSRAHVGSALALLSRVRAHERARAFCALMSALTHRAAGRRSLMRARAR